MSLYRAFLIDGFAFLRSLRTVQRQAEVCLDDVWHPDSEMLHALGDLKLTIQGPGDLGSRMLRAIERATGEGCEGTVIVGADAPTIPRELVDEAFRVLASGTRAVACPATDGGYVLIGCREPEAELFGSVQWGGSTVLATTRKLAIRAGFELHETSPWYDIDTDEDLARLRRDLEEASHRLRAPATHRFLIGR